MDESSGRTPLSELLSSMTAIEGGRAATITPDWLQGRAVYGGLSAALCLQATLDAVADLPPLRSVQLTFIGPAGSEVEIRPTIARQGKSTTFVSVDMHSDGKLAVRAEFCFGAARESRLDKVELPAPEVRLPQDCDTFFEDRAGHNRGPTFAQHFNSRLAAGARVMSAAETADFTVWLQLKDGEVDPLMVGLVALADALPPAAMACFSEPAPISTMTWMFDVLSDAPTTDDGWWLCRSQAEATRNGYSSQGMTIWNRAGEPIVAGRQNIAIFY